MVSNANDIFPRDFWTLWQKFSFGQTVNLMNAFTNCFNQHTTGRKLLHPIGRHIIILSRLDINIPILELPNGVLNLLKYAYYSIPFI